MGMTIEEAMNHIKYGIIENNYPLSRDLGIEACNLAISIMRKYQQLEDFAKWVAEEVIDEELWEFNYPSFPEVACRKLVRLGIMQESDGYYTYEPQESEE